MTLEAEVPHWGQRTDGARTNYNPIFHNQNSSSSYSTYLLSSNVTGSYHYMRPCPTKTSTPCSLMRASSSPWGLTHPSQIRIPLLLFPSCKDPSGTFRSVIHYTSCYSYWMANADEVIRLLLPSSSMVKPQTQLPKLALLCHPPRLHRSPSGAKP